MSERTDDIFLTVFMYEDDGPIGHTGQDMQTTHPWRKVFVCYGDEGHALRKQMGFDVYDGRVTIGGKTFTNRKNPRINYIGDLFQSDLSNEWRQDTFVYGTPFQGLDYPKVDETK